MEQEKPVENQIIEKVPIVIVPDRKCLLPNGDFIPPKKVLVISDEGVYDRMWKIIESQR